MTGDNSREMQLTCICLDFDRRMYHNKRPPIINAIHPTTTPIIITIDMPLVPAPFSGPTDVFFVLELTKGEVKLGLELLVFLTTWTDLSPNLSI